VRCHEADQYPAEKHAGSDQEPALSAVARELGILHREPVDALLGLRDALAQLLVLAAKRKDVGRRAADVLQLPRDVLMRRRRRLELLPGPGELLREARYLRLQLLYPLAGRREGLLGRCEPLPRDRLGL